MLSFNLTDEKWIPCITAGGRREEVSLKEALTRAQGIVEIFDQSPLIVVAIHRLLLAVLHRNLGPGGDGGPGGEAEWETLWKEGWDNQRVLSYLDIWRNRFDLFDESRPFYQCATMPTMPRDPKGGRKSYSRSIAKMYHDLSSGNNSTLFDHTYDEHVRAASCSQAARLLVAFQGFAIGGLATYEKGQDLKLYKSADNAPLVKGAVVLVKGRNLFQTLMLNLHKYNRDDAEPFQSGSDDVPAWEREEETLAEDRRPRGYLDLLTWQSRRIRLIPETDGGGQLFVKQVVIMKGNQFPDDFILHQKEPMLAFKKNPKPAKGQNPWPPLAFRQDRVLWRDSLALFESVAEERTRPKILDWLGDLSGIGAIPYTAAYDLSLAGLVTDQARIILWRREHLPLPLKYLEDDRLIATLKECLAIAEEGGSLLHGAVWRLVQLVVAPDAEKLNDSQKKDAANLADHLAVARPYWAALGLAFHDLLNRLPGDSIESDGEIIYGGDTLPWWIGQVRRAAWQAFREATDGLDRPGRTLKAVTIARQVFESGWNTRLNPLRGRDRKEGET